MRKNWPWQSLLAVAIAASGAAWAQTGAGSPAAEGTHQATPKMQGGDNGTAPNDDNGTSNSGPSPRDEQNPGLRIDPRMRRLPAQRGDNGKGSTDPGAQGNDNGTNGQAAPGPGTPGEVVPQNPATPQTRIFPANPPPPADPGQPGNPVTPTAVRSA